MRYVTVYKDLSRIHPKILFNLTKRQLICFGLAGAAGLPFYWFTHGFLGNDISVLLMMLICAPFLLAAVYRNRKTGEPFEKILFHILRAKFLYPQARPFKSENLYAIIHRSIQKEKEAKRIAQTKSRQNPVRKSAVRRSTGGASRKGRAK